jgi:two-component system catabolic regulation response regulator CreB
MRENWAWMKPPRILLVEDEPAIADTLVYALRTEGFAHAWASTGQAALGLLAAESFDLIILDVGLPDANGFDLCRQLRTRLQTPVLFLTARQGEVDRIVGLEIGGDDYVTKPFSPREVTARIRAILRRVAAAAQSPAPSPGVQGAVSTKALPPRAATWDLDEERQRIRHHGIALELTRNEYRLLRTFLRRPGRIFSREDLLAAAWDEPEASTDRTVDAHVKLLRAKIRTAVPESDPIQTHRGLGYSLREDQA